MTDSNADGSSGTNPSDPSGFLNPPQKVVKIVNTAREDLNGKLGVALSFDSVRNRYTISLPQSNPSLTASQTQQPSVLALKPTNLIAASMMEKMQYRTTEARQQAEMIYNDPRVRRQFQRFYDKVQNKLPPGVKPEYAAYATLALFLACIYFFGFTKCLLALSLLFMPIVISAPDLLSGNANLRTVARNFPSRLRYTIVEMTGFTRISDRMAMAGFAVLVLMCVRVLMTPAVSSSPPPSTSMGNPISSSDIPRSSSTFQSKLEDYYKLGFEDATSSNPFGHSLPTEKETLPGLGEMSSLNSADRYEDDLNWAYNPSPPPKSKNFASKFGFGTVMAMFALFRTVKDLGTGPDGRLDFNLLIANVKMLDPMRLGLLGLSLYRIISVFVFQ